ncbi:MAG: DNA repair protein RecO [Bacteroidaceae bacterium]|nr:DNA repair protein RecO [Prevotellaceae bacterium]MDY5632748.1 DNA repair protein RecO [Bacteroidaceae bacterium]
MLEKTRAIVLHTIRYNDKSLIAEVFTESHGAVSFMVRIPNARKSVMKNVLLSPLTLLEIDYDHRDNLRLQRLIDVRVWEPYSSLPYHPLKQTIALFLGEFLFYALRNEGPSAAMFRFLVSSLQWLDTKPAGFANYPITFLIRLSRFLGIWPTEEEAQRMLPADEQSLVPLILRMDFATMHLFQFTTLQRQRLLVVLNDYYQHHITGFPSMKSMAILREVLS